MSLTECLTRSTLCAREHRTGLAPGGEVRVQGNGSASASTRNENAVAEQDLTTFGERGLIMDVLLIAGLWLDQSAWDEVAPALEALGHRAVPLTLPGQGDGS